MSLKCWGCEEQLTKPVPLLGSGMWAVVQGCSQSVAQRMVLACWSPSLMSLSNKPWLCHKLRSCHSWENFPDGHTVWQRKRWLQPSCSHGPGHPPQNGASPITYQPSPSAAQRILKDGGLLPSFFRGDMLHKRLGLLYLPERYQKRSESNELGPNICHSSEDLTTMDRGAWQATVHGVARVRHNLATKPPPPAILPKEPLGAWHPAGASSSPECWPPP